MLNMTGDLFSDLTKIPFLSTIPGFVGTFICNHVVYNVHPLTAVFYLSIHGGMQLASCSFNKDKYLISTVCQIISPILAALATLLVTGTTVTLGALASLVIVNLTAAIFVMAVMSTLNVSGGGGPGIGVVAWMAIELGMLDSKPLLIAGLVAACATTIVSGYYLLRGMQETGRKEAMAAKRAAARDVPI